MLNHTDSSKIKLELSNCLNTKLKFVCFHSKKMTTLSINVRYGQGGWAK